MTGKSRHLRRRTSLASKRPHPRRMTSPQIVPYPRNGFKGATEFFFGMSFYTEGDGNCFSSPTRGQCPRFPMILPFGKNTGIIPYPLLMHNRAAGLQGNLGQTWGERGSRLKNFSFTPISPRSRPSAPSRAVPRGISRFWHMPLFCHFLSCG